MRQQPQQDPNEEAQIQQVNEANQERNAENNDNQDGNQLPGITTPKGGGAISGIGEKFQANPVTGTGSMSVPVALSPGRNGFTPQLALQYDSGSGNGIFGMGWSMSIPSISRKTQKGLPKYQDNEESDIFLLAGAEDLVPALQKVSDAWEEIISTQGNVTIKRYRPRIEGLFAKIEKHTHSNGHTHWKVTTKDNITSVYGESDNSRISDPDDSTKVFQWMLEYTYDEKGNITLYEYKQEDTKSIDSGALNERNRLRNNSAFNYKYLKAVKYTPDTAYNPSTANYFDTVKWHFQLVLDYGEHDEANPTINEVNDWPVRQDPFSSYRAGFELRTYRLCRRVLMFHYFENDLGAEPYLVKSTEVNYDENPIATRVLDITQKCHQQGEPSSAYPPVSFKYSEATISNDILQYAIEDAENLPIGVDGGKYRWTDLHGEGLPGVLIEDTNAWYFKRNLGDDSYYKDLPANATPTPEARLGAIKHVAKKPSIASLQNGTQQITDVDGNGTQDLLVNGPILKGFYAQNSDGQWENFKAFENVPNISWNDPNLRLIDLDGDGFADIMITEDYCFTCYPSLAEDGFGSYYRTTQTFEEEDGPAIIFADLDQSIYLSDMSGDGLVDIVRIKNNMVCYWPNLGYGKFGAKITMNNAPLFDHDDIFNQSRIRLADIDGSGTTDIVYIGEENVSYYPNQSGNSLGEVRLINQRLPTHDMANITTLDILGNGTQCLVWSSPIIGDHPPALKFIDLMGGIKPYLMIETNNNMGSLTRLKYAPSTKFYLRDEKEGRPWITKLPFPVQVLERVELWDEVNRNRYVTRYAYHHGYYDGREREFRGFGMVEQWDTETFTDFTNEGLFPPGYNALEEVLHVPPIHTKTWFHTGFYQEGEKILAGYEKEYWNDDPDAAVLNRSILGLIPGTRNNANDVLGGSIDLINIREAARALKGVALRQEVYSLDGSPEQYNPYTVTENNYDLKLIQPRAKDDRRDRDYASYLTIPGETVAYQYERNPVDPRVSHQVTLEVDNYGNVLKAAAVGYRRRTSEGHAEQDVTLITFTEATILNEDNNASFYRLGVPLESKNFELTGAVSGLPTGSQTVLLTKENLLQAINDATEISFDTETDGSLQKRLLDHSRIYFYDEQLNETTPLPFGQVASHGLPFETYQLALTPGLIDNVLNDDFVRVNASLLAEGQYRDLLGDGHYWIPSGKVIIDSSNFYLPTAQEDPFGNRSSIVYDPYHLAVVQTTDVVGNTATSQNDYRLLQPTLITDPNLNRQEFSFDVRGMVSTVVVMGKEGSSDGDTLADPTATFTYDLFRWMNEGKPNFAYSRTREKHKNAGTRWQEAYAYSDGLGQIVMTKAIAAPGDAYLRDAQGQLQRDGNGELVIDRVNPRWVGNGRTIIDNKGNPVKQYEPYYSSTYEYEDEAELVEYGVTPIIRYDPLGRAIKTDLPDDTLTKVAFDPWRQASYDQNDTVLESLWYVARNSPDHNGPEPADPDERAAWLAAKHADTPQVVIMDTLGRPFLTIDDNATDGLYEMRTILDIKGNPRAIIDAKGRQSFSYHYDMVNQPLHTDHIDNGKRYALGNAVGNPLSAWDDRSQHFSFAYDELQRPTHSYLTRNYDQPTPDTTLVIGRTVYGEQAGNPENKNLRGQPYLIFDSSGMTKNVRMDFKGNLYRSARQLALQYQSEPDWSLLDTAGNTAALLNMANTLLESELFEYFYAYDALNRVTNMQAPDDSDVSPVYDELGQLERIRVNHTHLAKDDIIEIIEYNARGQRERIKYGNQSQTTYQYDANTFRLTQMRTTRDSGSTVLQEIDYFYDPVGNITEMHDNAQQTVFFNNTQVDPHTKYTYDALYRLLSAQGRELASVSGAPGSGDLPINPLPDNNTAALRLYDQRYEYDQMGNILRMIHNANSNNWTRHYHYDTNNYLLSTSNDGIAPTNSEYTYDAHGNMIQMPHLNAMSWDYADRLLSADLGGGGTVYYAYDAGGDRVRKVIENGNIKEERIYLGDWEVYRKYNNGVLETERESLHILDDRQRIALMDTMKVDGGNAVSTPVPTQRYQLGNHLDSASLELDESAAIISYEEYYPFGSSSYRSGRNNAETSLKRYRYVGKERDDETGLYYYGARYYAAWLARFVSVDPLKDDYPQLNPYNYASNNPITSLDLEGLQNPDEELRPRGLTQPTDATSHVGVSNKMKLIQQGVQSAIDKVPKENISKVARFAQENEELIEGISSIVFGILTISAGIALAAVPVPGLQVLGTLAIIAGSGSVAFGLAKTTAALADKKVKALDESNNLGQMVGNSLDESLGTDYLGTAGYFSEEIISGAAGLSKGIVKSGQLIKEIKQGTDISRNTRNLIKEGIVTSINADKTIGNAGLAIYDFSVDPERRFSSQTDPKSKIELIESELGLDFGIRFNEEIQELLQSSNGESISINISKDFDNNIFKFSAIKEIGGDTQEIQFSTDNYEEFNNYLNDFNDYLKDQGYNR